MEKVRVVCVLKSGGEYLPRHVYALQDMCRDFLPDLEFVCLTDASLHCNTIPLFHNWPGWWSKIELFKLKPPVLFFDLDTVLLKDCSEIVQNARGREFVILRDVYRGHANPKAMQSSMMYWERDLSFVYDRFLESPDYCEGGDQSFLEKVIPEAAYWQDLTDGIVSYKANICAHGIRPEDRIVIFHGKPRPWEQTQIAYPT